jgi:quinoprotein relay system zinc metallohydrolase 2
MNGFRSFSAALMLVLAPGSGWSADALTPLPVREIADGVFVYEAPYTLASPRNSGAIANAGFIVGEDCVAVIDTEASYLAGRRLLAAVEAHTSLPIRYVVNTHFHPDHVLGNAAFAQDGVIFVGHENLADALSARKDRYVAATKALIGAHAFAGTEIVLPTIGVRGRLELDLGSRRLILEGWPTAHTNSDLTVFDEKTATWFLGDLLFSGHVPALDGSLNGWIRVAAALTSRQAARVVPGHGPSSLAWPEAARPMTRYLERLGTDVRRMIREGRTMSEAATEAGRTEARHWSLFEEFNSRNATTAFHELEWE